MKYLKDTHQNATYSNIFLISCRRSGTHLLTDLIVNNFNYKRIDDDLDIDENLSNEKYKKLISKISKGKNLIWTHTHSYEALINRMKPELKEVFHNSKIIFIHRDIKDIITSYYYRPWQSKSIKELLKSKNEDNYTTKVHNYKKQYLEDALIEYQENWFSILYSNKLFNLDMISISFEEIIKNYENSVYKIGKFLNKEVKSVLDVRLKSEEDKKNFILYTCNDFRNGKIGDYTNLLSKKDIKRINEKSKNINLFKEKFFNNKDSYTKTHNIDIRKKFKLNSRDWGKLNNSFKNLNKKINEFNKDSKFNPLPLIENRFKLFDRKNQIKNKQTIFLNSHYVLKFLLPIKINIERKDKNFIYPILTKEKINHFIISYPFLKNIMPKIHHIGIYNDTFYMIQERIEDKYILKDFKNPEENWKYLYENEIYKQLKNYFSTGLKNNICLYDLTYNLDNLAIKNNKLLYLDGDGYFYFDDSYDIENDISYQITLNHLNKISNFKY